MAQYSKEKIRRSFNLYIGGWTNSKRDFISRNILAIERIHVLILPLRP